MITHAAMGCVVMLHTWEMQQERTELALNCFVVKRRNAMSLACRCFMLNREKGVFFHGFIGSQGFRYEYKYVNWSFVKLALVFLCSVDI